MLKDNTITNITDINQVSARPHQINYSEAKELKVIDLFNEVENNQRMLSRADLLVILTVYENGLKEFLSQYKDYISELHEKKGYIVVPKPHYFLKNILG